MQSQQGEYFGVAAEVGFLLFLYIYIYKKAGPPTFAISMSLTSRRSLPCSGWVARCFPFLDLWERCTALPVSGTISDDSLADGDIG